MKTVDNELPPKVKKEALREHFSSTYQLAENQIDIMLASSSKSLNSSLSLLYRVIENDEGYEKLHKLAHSIKGLLLNMGETQWAELARELELAAADEQQRDYKKMVQNIHYGVEDIL